MKEYCIRKGIEVEVSVHKLSVNKLINILYCCWLKTFKYFFPIIFDRFCYLMLEKNPDTTEP